MRIMKMMAFGPVLALALGLPLLAQEAVLAGKMGEITVAGVGRVALPPDLARVTLGVTTQADTAAAAMAANSTAMAEVLARLRGAGVAEADLQTSSLSLQPNWQGGDGKRPLTIVDYIARNQATATVRDLANLGAVLDAAVVDGANTLDGVEFGLSDPEPALQQARVMAVQDAVDKASTMLGAAGVKLGKIVLMNETGGNGEMVVMARMAADSAPVPIASGTVETMAQVSITFEIVQ